ncbi:MAG TPA: ribonuclease D [Actinomycetota bacterium]|nr:ribonuclease D [Actinomycetota bacterium]
MRSRAAVPVTIATGRDLERIADEARSDGALGLDTEFMRERTYRARLCLVQVATRSAIYLLDPLDGADLSPLGELLGAEDVEIVVHAGRQDLELFHETLDVVPRNVFDVQLAAAFAGHGASLPYGRIVAEIVGARITKGESYSDWCRRPLSRAQLDYAADDVRYLLDVSDALKRRLRELGRLEWLEEEMVLQHRAESYELDLDGAWRKVGGRGSLSGRQIAVLREVARWREEAAARRDIPRGWVLKDPTLVEIARRAPATSRDLARIRGISTAEVERSGGEIVAAVERGRNAPAVEQRPSPPREALLRARLVSSLADALVRARCERASIATELVATRGDLEEVLAERFAGDGDGESHRLLQGWRREIAGTAVLDLADGRIALRALGARPWVEEVPL